MASAGSERPAAGAGDRGRGRARPRRRARPRGRLRRRAAPRGARSRHGRSSSARDARRRSRRRSPIPRSRRRSSRRQAGAARRRLRELTYGPYPVVATYSIVACDLHAGQWGVAVQSKFLAVGSVVPWAEPQVGAIATQSYANPRYGPEGLALLREGRSARRSTSCSPRRRGPRRAPGRRRRRRRGALQPSPAASARLGRRPHRRVLRRAGQHPRLGRDGGRARRDVRVERRTSSWGSG